MATSHWGWGRCRERLLRVVRATAVAQKALRRGCTASRMRSNAHGNCGGRPRAGIGKFFDCGKRADEAYSKNYLKSVSQEEQEYEPQLILNPGSPEHRRHVPAGGFHQHRSPQSRWHHRARCKAWTGCFPLAKVLCAAFLILATQMVSMDYNSNRVNVHVDAAGNVSKVRMG